MTASSASSWRFGVAAGYSEADFHVSDRASSGSEMSYHPGLATARAIGALWACASAAPSKLEQYLD